MQEVVCLKYNKAADISNLLKKLLTAFIDLWFYLSTYKVQERKEYVPVSHISQRIRPRMRTSKSVA